MSILLFLFNDPIFFSPLQVDEVSIQCSFYSLQLDEVSIQCSFYSLQLDEVSIQCSFSSLQVDLDVDEVFIFSKMNVLITYLTK